MIIKSQYPINVQTLTSLQALMSEYGVLCSAEVDYDNARKKTYLTDSISRKCRFCGDTYPKVTFRKIAHSFPEFIGNKTLISRFECDKCNEYFGKFESEFSNFMLPHNAVGGVKNKSNKPTKYKQDIKVYEDTDHTVNIENFPDEIALDGRSIEFSLDNPSYIPDFVYRCLIKIGLTIIPEKLFGKFRETLSWLMDVSADTAYPATMVYSIFPFENPSSIIRCVLFQRHEAIEREIPEILILISYRNFAFQTFFPDLHAKDSRPLIPFPYLIPTLLDLELGAALEKSVEKINLSNKEKFKGRKSEFVITPLDGRSIN